jgi:hypothetical protein
MIGAVTSNRSSLADSAPQQNTSAATMARSETLIVAPRGHASGRYASVATRTALMVCSRFSAWSKTMLAPD